MAARLLQRRISSALFGHQSPASLLFKDNASSFGKNAVTQSSLLSTHNYFSTIQTQVEPSNKNEAENDDKKCLKTSPRHDLAMMFTCKVCETRSVKTMSRDSYENGVVVVTCGGCNNKHLIADRLGMFGEPGSVEDFLAARGEEFIKGDPDTLNLTLEDLAGKKNISDV
ncbi:hypothetical protein IFM89_023317 [Coptis chinensis]|uniref:DNL-type domain-containing protein n=1 Tax=Coptis chinensis TaxID=261450 RepID=A0A835HDN9_9MAGN|nr:hypothetical protein IFM89_023317 [Coptis chinensis]